MDSSNGDDPDAIFQGKTVTWLHLAHYSVKEYLVTERVHGIFKDRLSGNQSRAFIVGICLTYLTSLPPELSLDKIRSKFPFAQYSARSWAMQAKAKQGLDASMNETASNFLLNETQAYTLCCRLHGPDRRRMHDVEGLDLPPPLYYASSQGLAYVADKLLDEGADVNAQGRRYSNTLRAASRRGHGDIVQLLLDRGANVNAHGGRHGSMRR